MDTRKLIGCFFWVLYIVMALPGLAQKKHNPLVWENEINEFEKSDSLKMLAPGAIVFTGSSSIRMWNTLKQDFPNKHVLNRGFGGSQIQDAIHYFDKLVTKYQPNQVVLYAGDNDIASGKSPEEVVKDFKAFANLMKKKLPESELIYLSIKPSLARWNMYDKMQEVNQEIRRYAYWHDNVTFVDVSRIMLGADGKPEPELFIQDGLHMTPEGYQRWTKQLKPYLAK